MGCECEVCGQGPQHGTSVYRTTPKGQAPRWHCEMHLTEAQRPAKDVAELVAIIEADNRPKQ